MLIAKPDRIFDRDVEWRQLAAFASRSGAQLGVVTGRRRQGKTFLVEALARQTGGLYFGATQATQAESLRLFAQAVSAWVGAPVPLSFPNWDAAITYLFVQRAQRGPVVIDEFPYLMSVSPSLPSIVQREVDRALSSGADICLLLCGSALSVMGGLLSGSAPLRGRAALELVVRPFPYPLAARFWAIRDPSLAVCHHAVVGGTPAYRRYAAEDAPSDVADFDDWLCRTVLDPATPLFREARYLLREEADVRYAALYHSVLAAVAHGNNTRGGIASYIGRKAGDIGHHLNVLEDSGLLRRDPDVFRSGRSTYRIAEPLITFYQAIMRPQWGLLESGRAELVWRDARTRFGSQVVGPHFKELCRQSVLAQASDTLGGLPGEVGAGVVADPARRSQIQVDVAVLAPAMPGEPRRLLALGKTKWGDKIGIRHVERLRRARDLLTARGYDTRDTRLVGYSGVGVDPRVGDQGEGLLLFGPGDLYPGLG